MSEIKKVAVVTGANRGLGWETCRQLAKQGIQVILTSRDEEKGKAAAEKLQAYRISKTALNVLTRMLAYELKDTNILVNSVCPGWVKTDMGGPNATRTIEQGADTIVWLATLPDDGPTNGFFRDRQPLDW